MYQRVVPRDLFNESKLLKCLGQLALLIEDRMAPKGLFVDNSGQPFVIDQRDCDGCLFVSSGIRFLRGNQILNLYSSYNSKENYPLYCGTSFDEVQVFNPDGSLTEEFIKYVS